MTYKYWASLREVKNFNRDYTDKYDTALSIDDMIRRYLTKQTWYHWDISPRSFDVAFLARIENTVKTAFIISILLLFWFVISVFIIWFKESVWYASFAITQMLEWINKVSEISLQAYNFAKIVFAVMTTSLFVKIFFTYFDIWMHNTVDDSMLNEFEKSFMNYLQKPTIQWNLEILEWMTWVDDKAEDRRKKLVDKYRTALNLPWMIWEA